MEPIREAEKAYRHLRILVVDDNAAIRQLMATMLAEEGFEVDAAVDGADALGKLGTNTYDVVVSDLEMPGMDGLTLLARIQRMWNGIPVIIQTARIDASLETNLHRAGAVGVVLKGQFEELLESLREAVATSKPYPWVAGEPGTN